MTDLRTFAKIFYFCAHRIIILSRASPVLIFPMSVQSNESKVFSKHISNFFTNFESFPRQVTHNIWNWILKLFTVKIPFSYEKNILRKTLRLKWVWIFRFCFWQVKQQVRKNDGQNVAKKVEINVEWTWIQISLVRLEFNSISYFWVSML